MCLRPRVVPAFKEKQGKEGTGVVGSDVPDALATTPLISHNICTREVNHRSFYKGL
jgi:hypothetical protein